MDSLAVIAKQKKSKHQKCLLFVCERGRGERWSSTFATTADECKKAEQQHRNRGGFWNNLECDFTQTDAGTDTLWTAGGNVRNEVILVNLPSPSAPAKFIRYEVTRTGINAHALCEIEYFGFPAGDDPNLFTSASHTLGQVPATPPTQGSFTISNTG